LNKAVLVVIADLGSSRVKRSRIKHACRAVRARAHPLRESTGDVGDFTVLWADDVLDEREVQRAQELAEHQH
jgi:hypothetical protein